MQTNEIVQLITNHALKFTKTTNVDDLLTDWINTSKATIVYSPRQYRQLSEIKEFYSYVINTYTTRKLRLTDYKIESLADMAYVKVYFSFEGTNTSEVLRTNGKIEFVTYLDEDQEAWKLHNIKIVE